MKAKHVDKLLKALEKYLKEKESRRETQLCGECEICKQTHMQEERGAINLNKRSLNKTMLPMR